MSNDIYQERLNSAIELIKSGKKKEGGQILVDLAKSKPNDENIWLWLAVCVNNKDKKKEFLQRVLNINPDSQIAKEGLENIIRSEMQPDLSLILSQENVDESVPHDGKKKTQIIPIIVIVGGVVLLILALFIIIFEKNLTNKVTDTVIPTDIPSRCTNELISKVRRTAIHNSQDEFYANLGKFSEDFMQIVHLDNLRYIEWLIEERGEDGCVISMMGEKNGISYELLRFYLDLNVGKISADNQDTQYIFESFGQTRYLGGVYLNNGR